MTTTPASTLTDQHYIPRDLVNELRADILAFFDYPLLWGSVLVIFVVIYNNLALSNAIILMTLSHLAIQHLTKNYLQIAIWLYCGTLYLSVLWIILLTQDLMLIFFMIIVVIITGLLMKTTDFIIFMGLSLVLLATIPTLAWGNLLWINKLSMFAFFTLLCSMGTIGIMTPHLYGVAEESLRGYEREYKISLRFEEAKKEIERQMYREQRLMRDLEKAQVAAQTATEAKSTFLATMSHELRTPINAILGFAQLLEIDPEIKTSQKKQLKIIIQSTESLLGLINDVLDLAKIEAGYISQRQEALDLYRLLKQLQQMFTPRAQQQNLQFILDYGADVPQFILTDAGKLRQVLVNLLGNAFKFTSEGGITLRVRSQLPEDETYSHLLFFAVEDTGIGIAPEKIAHIFETFVQVHGWQESAQGTGLGLTISRHYVEFMGGRLTVNSRPNHGSTFEFSIPVKISDAPTLPELYDGKRVVGLESKATDYRILIVEDNPESRHLLTQLHNRLGLEVRQAVNGQEGIALWEEWQPHLIWMDMRMPVLDGYEATRQIKAAPQGQNTKIIALTASAFEHQRKRILSAGCDDFLAKPFREQAIFEKLAEHLTLEYIYEVVGMEAAPPLPPAFNPPATPPAEPIPPDLLQNLRQAARDLNVAQTRGLLTQLRAFDPELAQQLEDFAQRYRFDEILARLETIFP